MNDEAQRLGMKGTHFADVNGMPDPNHYDGRRPREAVRAPDPRFSAVLQHLLGEGIQHNNIRQGQPQPPAVARPDGRRPEDGPYASSRLLPDRVGEACDPGVDGQRRLVSVMMGEQKEGERTQDSMKMLNYGYSAFDSVRLFKGGKAMSTPRVYKGKDNTVQVGVKADQWATVPRGLGDKIKTEVDVNAPLIAPLAEGQQVGTVKIVADGRRCRNSRSSRCRPCRKRVSSGVSGTRSC